MDEQEILEGLAEDFYQGWEVMATGGGFLIITDWMLAGNERIELHVRRVGEREDLFIVTDGGELISHLYSQGIDLSQDRESQRILNGIADNRSIRITDHQLVKGANAEELPGAIRVLLEAVKEASFALWHKTKPDLDDPVH